MNDEFQNNSKSSRLHRKTSETHFRARHYSSMHVSSILNDFKFSIKNDVLCETSLRTFSAATRSIFNPTTPNESFLIVDITMRERFHAKWRIRIHFSKLHVQNLDFQPLTTLADVPSTVITLREEKNLCSTSHYWRLSHHSMGRWRRLEALKTEGFARF